MNFTSFESNERGLKKLRNPTWIILVVLLTLATCAWVSVGPTITFGASNVNIAAAGDWGCTGNTQETVKNVQGQNPDLVLALGDFSYSSTSDCWINEIRPIWSITKINFGNHDVENPTLENSYLNSFGLSKQYYSYKAGNVHVLTMSTEQNFAKGSPQYNFVLKDLENANSDPSIKWIIVTMHIPLYASPNTCGAPGCSGDKDLRDSYHQVFDKYGVDLVLAGHVHNYERTYPLTYNSQNPSNPTITSCDKSTYTNPDGEIYAIVGTGGENLHGLSDKSYFVSTQQDSKFGILNLHMSADSLEAKFIDNSGLIFDRFTINKNVNIKNVVATNCDRNSNNNNNLGFKSVSSFESDPPSKYYQVITYSNSKLKYNIPVLSKLQSFEPLSFSSHDGSDSQSIFNLNLDKTTQEIKQQIHQKVEKKLADLKLNLNVNTANSNKEKDKIDSEPVEDGKKSYETKEDNSWPVKNFDLSKKDKSKSNEDNNNVKEFETKSDNSWGTNSIKFKHKNKYNANNDFTIPISESIKQKIDKKINSRIFGSGFPFK
jgi:predicted phosphodiesterase